MVRKSPEYVWQCECGNEVVLPVSAVPRPGTRKCPECAKAEKQALAVKMQNRNKEIAINGVVPASLRNIVTGRLPANNTSGVRGVNKTKGGKWVASGRKNGKRVYLGTYATLKEAAEARERFVEQNYGKAFKKLREE